MKILVLITFIIIFSNQSAYSENVKVVDGDIKIEMKKLDFQELSS